MNSADLLAILGGGAPPGAGSSSRRGEAEGKSILSFKAGRMDAKVQMVRTFVEFTVGDDDSLDVYTKIVK